MEEMDAMTRAGLDRHARETYERAQAEHEERMRQEELQRRRDHIAWIKATHRPQHQETTA